MYSLVKNILILELVNITQSLDTEVSVNSSTIMLPDFVEGWMSWEQSPIPLLLDHQTRRLKGCWGLLTCDHPCLQLWPQPPLLLPFCPRLVRLSLSVCICQYDVCPMWVNDTVQHLEEVTMDLLLKYFSLSNLSSLSSGGGGLEAADAATAAADNRAAHAGLHLDLSCQGSSPGLQGSSGHSGPGYL